MEFTIVKGVLIRHDIVIEADDEEAAMLIAREQFFDREKIDCVSESYWEVVEDSVHEVNGRWLR